MLQKLPVGDSEWLKKHLNEDFMKNYDGDCGIGYFLFFFFHFQFLLLNSK